MYNIHITTDMQECKNVCYIICTCSLEYLLNEKTADAMADRKCFHACLVIFPDFKHSSQDSN